MIPKQYQETSRHWLGRYYQECRKLQAAGVSFPAATASCP